MRLYQKTVLYILLISFFFSNCATIVGGSKYNANVVVVDNPNGQIYYKGELQGTGNASFKVKRTDANKLVFSVKQEGCPEMYYKYEHRSFRGWAFVGSLLGFSLTVTGVPFPIPIGVITDFATGACWKPNIAENGVSKMDYKDFKYKVRYAGCPKAVVEVEEEIEKKAEEKVESTESFTNIVYLKNGSIVKGVIIEKIPNVQIKIRTKDDSGAQIYQINEIDSITRE